MTLVVQPHAGFGAIDPFMGDSSQRAKGKYDKLKQEADRRGWNPASLISMHAFNWPVSAPVYPQDLDIKSIPLQPQAWDAAPKIKLPNGFDVPYVHHVFTQWLPLTYRYHVGEPDSAETVSGDGHLWPLDQATDAVRCNKRGGDRGGVFAYEGGHLPGTIKETAQIELVTFASAHAEMMSYYRSQHEKYLDAWMSRQSTNSWKDLAGKGKYHRWIAQYLNLIGILAELPPYCQEYVSPDAARKLKCGSCQHNLEPGAVRCTHGNCTWVAQPFRAFAEYAIDETTPGARLAAKRLTTQEVIVLVEGEKLKPETLIEWGIEVPEVKAKKRA